MTEKDCNKNVSQKLGDFDRNNPLLGLVMLANGETQEGALLELDNIILDRSLGWINSISRLIETATWEGNIESEDVVAIYACSDLIRNLSDVSKYITDK